MKANKLRIGNLIRWISTGEIDTVKDIFSAGGKHGAGGKHESINNVNIQDCEPIPLTEEWLKRFGFEKNMEIYYYHSKMSQIIIKQMPNWHLVKTISGNQITSINNVHQLQNLYFAFTGNELKIIQK